MRPKPKLYMLPLADGGRVFADLSKREYAVERCDGAVTMSGSLATMPDELACMAGWHRSVRRAMGRAGT